MTLHDIQGHRRPISWLQHAVTNHQLGHAYLFHGEASIGKRLTASAFTQFLQCEHPADRPFPDACGICRSCHQVDQGTHPDVLLIEPDDEHTRNPKIKIEQIRSLEHFVIYRPLVGSFKVCLIDQADTMTIEGANALLKTLEDPPDHCVFLVVSSRPEHLLATIRSRCLPLRFSPLSLAKTQEVLRAQTLMDPAEAMLIAAFSEGRLGMALRINPSDLRVQLKQYWSLLFGDFPKSPTAIMNLCEDLIQSEHTEEALHWFRLGIRELLLTKIGETHTPVFFQSYEPDLRRLGRHSSPLAIVGLLEELERIDRGQQRHLNTQIGLEQFFFHLQDCLCLQEPRQA